jgi:geranylgeranyl transferase type-1 subunit beta
VGALSFLQRIPGPVGPIKVLSSDTNEFESLLKWLVFRQTIDIDIEDSDDEDDDQDSDSRQEQSSGTRIDLLSQTSKALENLTLDDRIQQLPSLVWAGFNGRSNKIADTCYSFWTSGALQVNVLIIDPS